MPSAFNKLAIEEQLSCACLSFTQEQEVPVNLTAERLSKLVGFLELLLRWNEKVDLVSPGTPQQLISRHFLDSIFAWALLNKNGLTSDGGFLDIGSGAGFPGLVLGIFEGKREVILCEPRDKRVNFLKEARRVLSLSNIAIEQRRVEDIEADLKLSLVITRATSIRAEFFSAAQRWLVSGGVAAEMRGEELSEKIHSQSFDSLGLVPQKELIFDVPGKDKSTKILSWKRST